MKAVIMAGGEGNRLRPLTCTAPKPMAMLCGKPVIEYILELLESNSFDEAVITLKYLPQNIIYFIQNYTSKSINIESIIEDKPLGTAGSVKNVAKGFNEPFLVISGDAICDFDLKSAYENHISSQSDLTIIGYRVDDPREYGLMQIDDKGSILSFIEKPGWSQVTENLANTGIYIINPNVLNLIPNNKFFDFASDLFPLMMNERMKLIAYEAKGYWCDIGDLDAYKRCQADIMNGKTKIQLPFAAKGVYVSEYIPAGNYSIEPPVYFGHDVNVEDKAVIGPNVVIEDGCHIGENTKIKNSIILSGAYIAKNVYINSSVICEGVVIKKGAELFEKTSVGANSIVGEFAEIKNNCLIWPDKYIEDNAVLYDNAKDGNVSKDIIGEEGIKGITFTELTCERAARFGASIGSSKLGKRICIANDGTAASKAIEKAVTSGVISTGAKIFELGECFEAQLYYFAVYCDVSSGVFISSTDNQTIISIVDTHGLPLMRKEEREIEEKYKRCDFIRCSAINCEEPVDIRTIRNMYQLELKKSANTQLEGLAVKVDCENDEITMLLTECLLGLKCKEGIGLSFSISNSGKMLQAIDDNGIEIPFESLFVLCCYDEFINGNDVFVSSEAPFIIDALAKEFGQNAYRYLKSSSQILDEKALSIASNNFWTRDALFMCMKILAMIKKSGNTLSELIDLLPRFTVFRKEIVLNISPVVLGEIFKKNNQVISNQHGLRIDKKQGKILVSPTKTGNVLKIFSEGQNEEIAKELCFEVEKIIKDANIDITMH